MIAADHENIRNEFGKATEEFVQQRDRLGGGNGFVVNIAGNQDGTRLLLLDQRKNPVQKVFLIVNQRIFIQPSAQMQVGQVHQFHCASSVYFKNFSGCRLRIESP